VKKSIIAEVVSNEEIASGIYKMVIKDDYLARNSKAGQFLHIKCSNDNDKLLRRPISICSFDINDMTVTIVYQVKGSGTKSLSLMRSGDSIDILGPLGKGYSLDSSFKKVLLVGGGIGIYPLYSVASSYLDSDVEIDAVLGFRTKDLMTYEDEFNRVCSDITIVTDDGSYGQSGTVIQPMLDKLTSSNYDMVYVCGPKPMINAIVEEHKRSQFNCEVSLEERMGCGVGACLVCACKTYNKDNEMEHKHVCKDGPVFEITQLYEKE